MKNVLLFVFAVVLFASCGKEEERITVTQEKTSLLTQEIESLAPDEGEAQYLSKSYTGKVHIYVYEETDFTGFRVAEDGVIEVVIALDFDLLDDVFVFNKKEFTLSEKSTDTEKIFVSDHRASLSGNFGINQVAGKIIFDCKFDLDCTGKYTCRNFVNTADVHCCWILGECRIRIEWLPADETED